MNIRRFDWTDLGFTGVASVADEYLVRWRVLDIVAVSIGDEQIGWWPKGQSSAFPPATDPDAAEALVEIDVKWDGCANYSWSDEESTHTCDGGKALAAMILRVHEVSGDLMAAERKVSP